VRGELEGMFPDASSDLLKALPTYGAMQTADAAVIRTASVASLGTRWRPNSGPVAAALLQRKPNEAWAEEVAATAGKLGAHNRHDAVTTARRHGLLI
jgi:hypothetical protein